MNLLNRIALPILCAALAACATMPTPRNAPDSQYQPSQQLAGERAAQCAPPAAPGAIPAAIEGLARISAQSLAQRPELLGPGDRILLAISGDEDVLSGIYVITSNGRLRIEGGVDVLASGRSRHEVEQDVRSQLITTELIRDIAGNVRLTVAESAGIQLSVSGAVFQQGLLQIGERSASARATMVSNPASGDFNAGRSLAWALRAAGGIRPDAEASTIYLIRDRQYAVFDVTPAFYGGIPTDPQLAAGDRILVPSSGCFRAQYVRPSSVTAPGIRVFMSNLSRPVTSNSAAGISKDATRFPYGARFSDGLMSANCVGGSSMTAARRAVLISRNPANERTVVIQRNVEDLMRDANRDAMDPYLMPGDGIACYDGAAMSLVDVITVVSKILGAGRIGKWDQPMNMMASITPDLKAERRLARAWRMVREGLPSVGRYRRYITSILPVLAIIWVATGAYIILIPRSYISEFTLILPGSGTGSSLNVESIGQAQTSSSSAFSSPALSPTENYKQMLTADITLRSAAKIAEEKEAAFPSPSIKLVDQTNLIKVKLSAREAEQANRRALALRAAFLAQLDSLRRDEASQRELSDTKQLAELSEKVRLTERRLIEFQAAHGLTTLEQFNKRISAVDTLREKEQGLRIELSQLSGASKRLGSSLNTRPRAANMAMRLRGDPLFQQLAQRYADSYADVSEKQGTLGPRHSDMVQVQNESDELRAALIRRGRKITGGSAQAIMSQLDMQLASGRSNLIQEMTVNDARAAGIREALKTLRGDLSQAQKQSPRLIAKAAELAELQRAQRVAEAVFSSALARLDTNKLDPFASYPLVQTLSEPSLPTQPSSPSTMLALLGAIAASLVTIISFGLLWLRQPILNKLLQKD